MKVTCNQLTGWTGKAYRTIKGRLNDAGLEPERSGNKLLYDSAEALEAIFTTGTPDGDNLDLQQERAKLAKKQAEKAELQIAQMKGQLVDVDEVSEAWTKYISNCRAKLLSMPAKISAEVVGADLAATQNIIKREVYAALTELSRG